MDVELRSLTESFLRNRESIVDYFENTEPSDLTRASVKAFLSHIFRDVTNEFKFFPHLFLNGEPELQTQFHKAGFGDIEISQMLNFKRTQQRFAATLVTYYFEEEGLLNPISNIRYRTNYNVKNSVPYITLTFTGFGEDRLTVTQEAATVSQLASGIVEAVVEAYRRIKQFNLPVASNQQEIQKQSVGKILELAKELQGLVE